MTSLIPKILENEIEWSVWNRFYANILHSGDTSGSFLPERKLIAHDSFKSASFRGGSASTVWYIFAVFEANLHIYA